MLHFQSPFFFFHLDCWSVRVTVNKTLFRTVPRCGCAYVQIGAIGVVARVCVAVRVKPTARLRNATSGCPGPQTTWTVLLASPHVDNHVYWHGTAIDSHLAVFVFLASQLGTVWTHEIKFEVGKTNEDGGGWAGWQQASKQRDVDLQLSALPSVELHPRNTGEHVKKCAVQK